MKEYLIKQPNHYKITNADRAYAISRGKPLHCKMSLAQGHYRDTAIINANDLNEVFEIGNIHHDQVERLGEFYSISVGDLIVDSIENKTYMVAPIGFKEI